MTESQDTLNIAQLAKVTTSLEEHKEAFKLFEQKLGERLETMQTVLEELQDDLKLRRWLARALKFTIIILISILGFLHAPDWLHHLLGVQTKK